MERRYHGASHLGRGGLDISLPPTLAIDRIFIERLELEWRGRLQLATYHNKPLVRIHELQKQLIKFAELRTKGG